MCVCVVRTNSCFFKCFVVPPPPPLYSFSYELRGLEPFTHYQASVASQTRAGVGNFSQPVWGQTLGDGESHASTTVNLPSSVPLSLPPSLCVCVSVLNCNRDLLSLSLSLSLSQFRQPLWVKSQSSRCVPPSRCLSPGSGQTIVWSTPLPASSTTLSATAVGRVGRVGEGVRVGLEAGRSLYRPQSWRMDWYVV